MPPRRKPQGRAKAPTSRVHKISSVEQWKSMLQKAGDGRIVVVQFTQSHQLTCRQMRPLFVRLSTSPSFRKAIFAEVEVEQLEELARGQGVTQVPTFRCYYQGELIEECKGGMPEYQLKDFIQRNVKEYCVSAGGPLALAAKLVAAAALLAGGALLYTRLRPDADDAGMGSSVDPSAQLLDVKKRIVAVQAKLRALEKANRAKPARAQRKLLEQLQAQRRGLERGMQRAPRGKGAQGGGEGGGRHRSRGAGHHQREFDIDAIARLRQRRRRGEVLYSDEEDTLTAAAAAEEAGGLW